MYYFFLKKSALEDFENEFETTRQSIEAGKTPVFSEMRCARSSLIESIPYYSFTAAFVVFGAILISKIDLSETLKMAIVLVINGLCGTISNSIFVFVKHLLRKNFLIKLGYEPNEKNFSVLESLEYQSVT